MQADSRQLASESGLFRFRSAAVLLLLAFAATVVGAQEGDNEPKQYLSEDTKFLHDASPRFAMQIPKKSRETWKFVDLEARRAANKERLELEKAKATEENRKNNIQAAIDRLDKAREFIKMRVEMVDEPLGSMMVEVNPATTTEKIQKPQRQLNQVPVRGSISKGLYFPYENNLVIEVKKATIDKEATSKADKKARRQVWIMEGKGDILTFPVKNGSQVVEGKPVWFRIKSMLTYNEDGTNRYRVNILQTLPWEMAEDKKKAKKNLKEMAKLRASLRGL